MHGKGGEGDPDKGEINMGNGDEGCVHRCCGEMRECGEYQNGKAARGNGVKAEASGKGTGSDEEIRADITRLKETSKTRRRWIRGRSADSTREVCERMRATPEGMITQNGCEEIKL